MNPKVDFFFIKEIKWRAEVEALRKIILDCRLHEELKWGVPCYTNSERNIVLIHAFKEYCAVLFFKGVLLKDSKRILIQQTKNVQSARQIRFTDIKEIIKLKSALKSYIIEAIQVEKSGLKAFIRRTTHDKSRDREGTI